jgi:parallel beta-helix repeat protein
LQQQTVAINVKDFGAVGNGAADDSLAVGKAIEKAPDGSTIYFPKGAYFIQNEIRITKRNSLRFTGEGDASVIKSRGGKGPRIFVFLGCEDIVIERLAFDLNGVTHFGGVGFYCSKRIRIKDNHFYDSKPQPTNGYDRYPFVFGVNQKCSEDIWITNNLIESLQIEVDQVRRVHIVGNRVIRPEHTTGIGWFSQIENGRAEDIVIRDNVVVDPIKFGINITLDGRRDGSRIRRVVIASNTVICRTRYPRTAAIMIGSRPEEKVRAKGVTWRGCRIEDNTVWYAADLPQPADMPGIRVCTATNTEKMTEMIVKGNQVIGNGKLHAWGIETAYLKDSVVSGNTVSGSLNGILMRDEVARNVFSNNRVTNVEAIAFALRGSHGGNRLAGNLCFGATETPLDTMGSQTNDSIETPPVLKAVQVKGGETTVQKAKIIE